jgi:hypothetical protein
MQTVKLLSWHDGVAAKAKGLAGGGVRVDAAPLVRASRVVGEMAETNPAALVLDMDRRPSNCREIALMLRASKSARHIPILFAGSLAAEGECGLPERFARLKAELPDIPYTAWADAVRALRRLLKAPATKPAVVPPARVYTTSLAQKLGIVSAAAKGATEKQRKVALLGAPEGFVEMLGDLPETVKFTAKLSAGVGLAIGFVRSLGELAALLDVLTYQVPEGVSAWIAYPKRGRGRIGEFTEHDVRRLGIEAGWVDYKICSIDEDWSGMKFARKVQKKSRSSGGAEG